MKRAAMLGCLVAALGVSFASESQTLAQSSRLVDSVREYRRANEHRIIAELRELLAIPNVATDTANIQRNAAKLREMLERRGFRVQFLPIEGRGPVVYGELATPGVRRGGRTVIFYCHYDGQPTDASRWMETKPWEPALRTGSHAAGGKLVPFPAAGTPYQDDWRIYARSASDDKAPIVALLAALDALRANKIALAVNVKLLLDGEEEAGSPNLERVMHDHRDLLQGDVLLAADGPVHQSGRPLLAFGNRGVFDMEITVYGPIRPLHSGHYGNWAPNPGMRLAQLLGSMKDASGRVLIAGFYDDVAPLSPREQRALDEMPANDADLMQQLELGSADGGGKKLVELINLPSLNIRGIRSGYVGAQSQNIISTEASASLDLRLVKNIDPRRQFERVVAHIRQQGYYVIEREPTREERLAHARVARVVYGGGYRASRTPMDSPVAQAVTKVMESAAGPTVKMPTMGGSAPMYIFEDLGLPVISVPIVNHDNSQHSENENLRLGNFWRGIEIFAALLAELKW